MVLAWFAHTVSYVTPAGGKEGGKNEKHTLCKTCFFRGLPIRASMSPLWKARKEEKTKKPHFVKRGFFVVCPYGPLCHPCRRQPHFVKHGFCVVCPYGPLCHPCERQGRRKKRKNHTLWFFRGLPIRASMSPLWKARKEENTKKPHFVKRGFFMGWFSLTPFFGSLLRRQG